MYIPLWIKRFVFLAYRGCAIKRHRLNYLFWETTLRCNLNCLHCGSDCTKESGVKDMPIDDFVQVLDDIKERNPVKNLTVCITGGEPLLRNDLELAGQQIIKRGFNWGIVTNGLLFSKQRFLSLLKAGLSSISFSLDGLESQHIYLRQNKASFKKVIEAIDIVVAFGKSNPHFVFDIITCVHSQNISVLRELRTFLIDKGVTRWRIFSIFPEGRAKDNNLALTSCEYKMLMDFISETRKFKNSEGKSIHLNYSCEGYVGPYELKVRDYFFFCQGGVTVGSVWCNGNVGACLSVRATEFIQGNIYNEKFMDIWNNRFSHARIRNWAKKGRCAHCKKWNYCLGNGLHLHNDVNNGVSHCNYDIICQVLKK